MLPIFVAPYKQKKKRKYKKVEKILQENKKNI
jgi:hypothetical protein